MTSTPVPVRSVAGRLLWVDRLRGLAVALMVLDHVLVQIAPQHLLRFTVTRLSLPLFMICAAIVWKPYRGGRWAVLAAVVAAEAVLGAVLGMSSPGIVAVFVVVLLGAHALGIDRVVSYAAPLLVVGLLQALYLPLSWGGYQPGLVLAWFCVGLLPAHHQWMRFGAWLPTGFESIGRRPLVWYVGHLVALVPLGVLGA